MQSRVNAPKHLNTSHVLWIFKYAWSPVQCQISIGSPCRAREKARADPGFSTRECLYSQLSGRTNTNVLGYTTSPSTAAFCPNCTSFQIQTEQSKSNNCLHGCGSIQNQKNKDRETNKQERKIMFLPCLDTIFELEHGIAPAFPI